MHAHYFKHFSGVHFEGKYFIGTFLRRNSGPRGCSGFRVTGMIKGLFWGLKFSIFGGRKILASIVWGSLIEVGIFGGYSKQFEYSR